MTGMISDFVVQDTEVLFSDIHCPVTYEIKFKYENSININMGYTQKRITFQNESDRTQIDAIMNRLNILSTTCDINNTIMDDIVASVNNVFTSAAKGAGIQKENSNNSTDLNNKPKRKKPWFDQKCQTKRKHFFRAKNCINNQKQMKIFQI